MSVILPQSSIKPAMRMCDPGTVAYNCARMGLPMPVLAMPMWEGAGGMSSGFGKYQKRALTGGAVWRSGDLLFDGSNDLMNVGSVPILNMTGPHTLSALVNRQGEGTPYTDHVLIAGRYDGDGGGYGLFYKTDNQTFGASVKNPYKIATFSAGSIGSWIHLVERFDGVNVKLSMNGVEKASTAAVAVTSNSVNFNIGGGWYKGGSCRSYFHGYIRNVVLFDIVLSNHQTTNLYNNSHDMFEPTRSPAIWSIPAVSVVPTGVFYGPLYGPLGGPI